MTATFSKLEKAIARADQVRVLGRVTDVVGLVVEASGPNAKIGDVCHIQSNRHETATDLPCEVVGFRGDRTLLMPLGELSGIRVGAMVRASGSCLTVPTGPSLLGRALDGLGEPLDGKGPLLESKRYPVLAQPPNPLERSIIDTPLSTGVRAIDGLLTLGVGQRMGIFAGSGVGKSTLLGMIARTCTADINVIALIGERGREVREFIENDLGEEGLRRSVIVCATSEQPALVRIKAAMTATAIAESFRDE
ncbi:MAG TPA: EscN/YscN/HrcN family type III secretion system ATPase, partial [Fimbriimonas sp.]|nr:EscN/YscN/HrcN family type III secretion system ATPase [Fimbriimonas sp.]